MQVAKPVAFEVELPRTHKLENPEIKKRLEAEQAAYGPQITLEDIQAKLKKAEEKRRETLSNQFARLDKKRVYKVTERKRSLDQQKEQELKGKSTTHLTQAEQKRQQVLEQKQNKLKKHLDKVEHVRKLKNQNDQQSLERQKTELDHKLEQAEKNRQQNLEQIKTIAHHAAEKKQSTTQVNL